jgi:hypothetical protein
MNWEAHGEPLIQEWQEAVTHAHQKGLLTPDTRTLFEEAENLAQAIGETTVEDDEAVASSKGYKEKRERSEEEVACEDTIKKQRHC